MISPRDETPPLANDGPGSDLQSATQPPDFDKKAEAHFLADEFGIAPIDAAEMLVPDEAEAQALATAVLAEERARDPLAGLPVPGPEKDKAHLEKDVADLEKPVVHEPSAPT